MGLKKWRIAECDKALAKQLAEECEMEVDPIVALIASARGYDDPMELEQFLSDEPYFTDPWETADISEAAEIVKEAIASGEKIAVFGDYDCDGVTATALLYSYLKTLNADCLYYIPDRFDEGYGMNFDAIKKLKDSGVSLIITVDNGISGIEEIKFANSLGMRVVVTDHHLPGEILPEAAAVVDPHRGDCPSTFKSICGAQVAFRLICVMENKEPEELLPYFADILALAVVGDIMPLTLENRSIVKCGVDKLKTAPLTGLSALLSVAGISQDSVDAGRIAFGLVPRINAAGRMGKASRAVELLITDNMMNALSIANEIDGENSARQACEKKILEEAIKTIEENGYMHDRVIVVSGEGWHHGVVGIVASRITEKYGAPSILISYDGELASGSGRSFEGFSLFNAISDSKDLMVKFGGHEQAAGLTLKTEDIPEFRRRINEYAGHFDYIAPVLELDCKLDPSALTLDLAFALKDLEPYGHGNKTPLFGIYGAKLQRVTPIANGKHLRLIFSRGQNSFQALLFGVTPDNFCFCEGDLLDLAVTVDSNYYKGEYSVSVQVKALRMNGTDDDILFKELSAYNDYCAGGDADISLLLPTREQVGTIYKAICEKAILPDRVKYVFMNTIGYGKTCMAVKTLEELGLIAKNQKGLYYGVNNAPKTNLLNSITFKTLTERSGN